MKYMRILVVAVGVAVVMGLGACSSKDKKSEESAADIEQAVLDGREAARVFVSSRWTDTTELQGRLLEARAKQSKYVTAGKPECAAAFDTAFVSTVRTVRPDVARHLDKKPE